MSNFVLRRRFALLAFGLAALVAALAAGTARAEVVTYSISGKVSVFTDTSGEQHYVPTSIVRNVSTFVGTFSFDNAAPGQISGSNGFYRGTALSLSCDITIDGQYRYVLDAPTAQDEIDILGTSFGLYKRGPTVATGFSPNPPFSHFEFRGTTQTNILSDAVLGNVPSSAGVSDQQTSGAPYYYIGANISSVAQAVPEPGSVALLLAGAMGLALRRGRRRVRWRQVVTA